MTPAAVLLATGTALAGPADAALTTAVMALDRQDYAAALTKAESVVADLSAIKAKNVPRAWRVVAEARLRTAQPGDATLAIGALEAAGACAGDEKWGADCRRLQEEAALALLNHVNAHHDPAPGQPDDATAAAALARAWPESWMGPLVQGVVAMDAQDRAAAALHYETATTRAAAGARPPHFPVMGMLAGYRVINTVQIAGVDKAQAELAGFGDALRTRYHGPEHMEALEAALATATETLRSTAHALGRLEEEATAPEAPTAKRVEWATLLDQMGRFDDATTAWEAAAESDPAHFEAWYFWGVHHYNRAAALQDRDPTGARAQLAAARPPFEHAAGLRPDDASLRSALVNICAVTGDLACMKRYQAPAP